ncbi:hypothetical protein LCGC14_1589610, partial [marine sediment metagenome]
ISHVKSLGKKILTHIIDKIVKSLDNVAG